MLSFTAKCLRIFDVFVVKSASKERGLDRGMSPAHSANRVWATFFPIFLIL